MRDGWVRRGLKAMARAVGTLELRVRRWLLARRGEPRYRLEGPCNGCGRCCEAPSVAADRLTFHLRSARALFLWWQRWVNGFELSRVDSRLRLFVFRCTHYRPDTKQCDSYDSRPLICRDYPRNLTYEAVPSLFPECSHTVVDRQAAALRQALIDAGVTGEKLEAAQARLFLKEDRER